MTVSSVVLSVSFIALVLVVYFVRAKRIRLDVATPSLVFLVLSIALYLARIIDGQDNVIDVQLYNNLSNGLRLYSIVAFVFTLILK